MAFETTLWSRVEAAGTGRASAADELAGRYRPALVTWLTRHRGLSADDAEDLAQDVFVRLFSRDLLARADRDRGRFRSWLLGVTKNVLRERRERETAGKRGGGARPAALDDVAEPAAAAESDDDFNAVFFGRLLDRALDELHRASPRQSEVLRLRVREKLSGEAIAARLGRTEGQVKSDLHRARERLARSIRAEIAAYASTPEEAADDLAAFGRLIGRG